MATEGVNEIREVLPISGVGVKVDQNAVNMSAKTPTSNGSGDTPMDEGIRSMDSSNGNPGGTDNFQQTLLDLKALNGQPKLSEQTPTTRLGDAENNVKKFVNNIENSKTCENGNDDIVILDDIRKTDSSAITGLGLFSSKNSTTSGTINVFDETKPSPFAINEKMRSSFRDIMNKIQENTPSLQKLLAKTKYTGLDTKDSKSTINHAAVGQSNGTTGKGDNLFDNLKEIQPESSTSTKEKTHTSGSKSTDTTLDTDKHILTDTSKPESEVIELDDSGELDTTHDDVTPASSEALSTNQKTVGDDIISNCDNKLNTQVQCLNDKNDESHDIGEVSKCDSKTLDKQEDDDILVLDEDPVCEKDNIKPKVVNKDQEMKDEEEDKLLSFDSPEPPPKGGTELEDKKDDSISRSSATEIPVDNDANSEDNTDIKMEVNEDSKKCENDMMEVDEESEGNKDKDSKAVIKSEKDCVLKSEVKQSEADKGDITDTQVKSETENDGIKSEVMEEDDDDDEDDDEDDADADDDDDNDDEEEDDDDCKIEKDSSDRKRPADENDDLPESATKRSRLDLVIGKLGSQIGISPDAVKLEEVSDSETTTASTAPTSATEETEEEEDFSKRKKKKRSIRLSEKALENLVKSKILKYLTSQKESLIADLQKKVDELQGTNEMWKNKVRELEKQVLDVTVLQQKHEKRKAKTAALRQISTKSIGIQVDVNKANAAISQLQQNQPSALATKSPAQYAQAKTPPYSISTSPMSKTTSATKSPVSAPASQNASSQVMLNPPATQLVTNIPAQFVPIVARTQGQTLLQPVISNTAGTAATTPTNSAAKVLFQSQTVRSILDTKRGVLNTAPANQTAKNVSDPSRNTHLQVSSPQVLTKTQVNTSPQIITQAQPLPVNMGSRPMLPGSFIVVSTSHQNIPSVNSTSKPVTSIAQTMTVANITQQPPKAKVIDLTQEEEGSKNTLVGAMQVKPIGTGQSVLHGVAPSVTGIPSQGIILSAAPTSNPMMRPSQQPAYQLVFNSTSPALKPGSLITLPVTSPAVRGAVPVSGIQQIGVPITPPQLRPVATTMVQTPKLISMSNITSASVLPPQLKPMQSPSTVARGPVSASTVSTQSVMIRQPPPLQTGPQNANLKTTTVLAGAVKEQGVKHPLPLPSMGAKTAKLPKPTLNISRNSQGIVLSWKIASSQTSHPDISSYQLYAYQETPNPATNPWRKVGDVKALLLPMACTLTQFQEGNKYHFAVRPVDLKGIAGPFSEPSSIHLTPTKKD